MKRDPYSVLGVSRSASKDDIKNAYRKLAKQYHPDKNVGDKTHEEKFKEINEAYDILKDDEKRSLHDMQNSNPFRNSGVHTDFYDFSQGHPFDFDDILRNVRNRNPQHGWEPKNRDVNLNYMISLYEAFTGKEQEVRFSPPGGQSQVIKVIVQPGVEHGKRLRFVGKGEHTNKNASPGDLYVTISISHDERFVRHGDNLSTTVQIDYIDAILGTDITVSTIEGGQLKVKVPESITVGQTLRVPSKGMPSLKDNTTRGDLMIELLIVPPKLNQEQLSLLREIKTTKNA